MMAEPRQQALVYLQQHRVMTLATTDGRDIWAAAVFYASYQFSLYFLSAEHTRHARHLAARPWAAATIQEDYADWQTIKGIQLEGPVVILQGEERERAIARFGEKYPFILEAENKFTPLLGSVNWYCLRPETLYFIDNSQSFGHREAIPLS